MIRAIIFDYNGVIVDTDTFDIKGIKYACTSLDIPFSKLVYAKFFTGRSLTNAATNYLVSLGEQEHVELFISNKKSYDRYYSRYIKPYEDSVEFILNIHDSLSLALVTGARKILVSSALTKLNIYDLFSVIITAEDCTIGKPNPEGYNMASLGLNKLGINNSEILVIEDHPLGIRAAKSAGLKCLAVTHTHKAEALWEADWIVNNLDYLEQRKLFTN